MPYNKDLDETLFSKAWEGENERLTVSVLSYNKGTKKIQIARENKGFQGDFKFAKLGRMNKEELEGILPMIEEALQFMD